MLGYNDPNAGMERCNAIEETEHVSLFVLFTFLVAAAGRSLCLVLRGGSALTPDQRNIAVYNLHDGLDLYAAGPYGRQRPRKVYRFNKPQVSKHALQVRFAHYGKALVCGTTTGGILLWEVATGDALQELNHAGSLQVPQSDFTALTVAHCFRGHCASRCRMFQRIS